MFANQFASVLGFSVFNILFAMQKYEACLLKWCYSLRGFVGDVDFGCSFTAIGRVCSCKHCEHILTSKTLVSHITDQLLSQLPFKNTFTKGKAIQNSEGTRESQQCKIEHTTCFNRRIVAVRSQLWKKCNFDGEKTQKRSRNLDSFYHR